jgi:Fuc2NAc and GlcNAc transferase
MRRYIAVSLHVKMFKSDFFTPVIMIFIILFSLISFGGVYLYKKIAIKFGIVANPNYRTLHELPVPRGGGVIFALLFTFSILALWGVDELSDQIFYMFGVGGFIATLFGFIDDVKNIRARIKLIVQLLLSGWVVYWLYISNLLLLNWAPIFIIIPACLFFMVWMMNAYNFMDGVDGMAASGAIFLSLTLALVLFLTNSSVELMTIFIFIAVTVGGFIVFNWPPATIFMGDAGSVFLGYIFGSLLLFTVFNNDISIWSWLTVFGYFFADTTVTQITRIILVKKWYLAHRSHAYQNLARITDSHLKVTRGVVLYNLVWSLPLAIWSALQPEMGMVTTILSISPALVVAYKYGPVFSSS